MNEGLERAASKYSTTAAVRAKFSRPLPPRWLWLAPIPLFPLAISGPNTVLALYAISVLALGLQLLWRPGEPPILLFIFLYQWVQSATGAFYGNAVDVPISELHQYWGRHEFASSLMLTGVLVLSIAMWAAAGKQRLEIQTRMKALIIARPFTFWVRVYAIIWVFSALCEAIAPMAGGLRLPFLTMSELKWAGLVLLTFAAFSNSNASARKIWGWIFLIELVLSLGGFFASFKEVFFFTFFGLAAASIRFGPRVLIPGALLAVAMVALSLLWTAIKTEYRFIVSGGTGQQVVLLDYRDRIVELSRLVGDLDGLALQAARDDLLSRLMYHVFFGAAAQTVPTVLPHTHGEIWGEAITRPLMPRVLFPNKRAINDSDLTNQFTGLGIATTDQGTSISMGYMAEAYIDFGPILMFLPIAALGVSIGAFYRWLLHQPGYRAAVGASLAPYALMPAHLAETSILKMVPSLILTLLASIVVIKFLAPLILRGLSRTDLRIWV